MSESLLSPKAVAERIGVRETTLANWRSQKMDRPNPLPYVRIGGLVRYRESDLERWIEKGRVSGAVEVAGTEKRP